MTEPQLRKSGLLAKRINEIDSSYLKHIVTNAVHPRLPKGIPRSACVFLLLCNGDEPYLLAIQKTDSKEYPWRNQVALPGGHMDEKDEFPVDTAYRELEEELKIPGNQVELIGSIGHFQTINHKDIEAFVGVWDGKGPVLYDPEEISRVLEIPLNLLVQIHSDNLHCYKPHVSNLLYFYKDMVIWGLTARILHHFIEIVFPYLIKHGYISEKT